MTFKKHTTRTSRRIIFTLLTSLALGLTGIPAQAGSWSQDTSFGSNPGNVSMYKYIPDNMGTSDRPLVLAIHGCLQDYTYADTAGWDELADDWKFYIISPQTNSSNNQNKCWNFFESGDLARGGGEALSLYNMVQDMISTYNIDEDKIFVTGLSSGGAMTNVMAAAYPDVFAGAAPMAGLPYKCGGGGVFAGLNCMNSATNESNTTLGNYVKNACTTTPCDDLPTISVWQGTADSVVTPKNGDDTVRQWLNAHGIDTTVDIQDTVKGHVHKVWQDSSGNAVVELYMIDGMDHGTAVDPGTGDDQCGSTAEYFIDKNICSSYYVGKYWGIDNSGSGGGGEDATPPTVSITAPSDSSTVSGNVTFTASASDNVAVDRVEFFVDGRLIAVDSTSSYSVTWSAGSEANGDHTLTVKAYDSSENFTYSEPITVTVESGIVDETDPVVSLTFPEASSTIAGVIRLAATADDDVGVVKVEFYYDNGGADTLIGAGMQSVQAGPWILDWDANSLSDGTYTLKAKAYDAAGNSTVSSGVSVTIEEDEEALRETFTDSNTDSDSLNADNTGWTAGSWAEDSSKNNADTVGSSSVKGDTSGYSLCVSETLTMSRSVDLGDNPEMVYYRQLDLSGTSYYKARFRVLIDTTAVETVESDDYAETAWTKDSIDLSSYANSTVTLKFEVYTPNDCLTTATAWIDDIVISGAQADSDVTAPTVNITAPTNNSTVDGTVTITATASDNNSVAKVEFYANGNLIGADETSPYSMNWDTTKVEDGDFDLMAKAYDDVGNIGSDDDTSVEVDNVSGGGGSPTITTDTFTSTDSEDGYVKAYSGGTGKTVGTLSTLGIGRGADTKKNHAILSFDTSSIPDTATVTKAYLTIDLNSDYSDPWASPSGNRLIIDIKEGCFNGSCTVEAADWDATADASDVAQVNKWTTGTTNSTNFNASGLAEINLTGDTQLRLKFESHQSSTRYIFIEDGVDAVLTVEYQD